MVWTDLEKYTNLINIFTRDAEGTALRHCYRPTRDNVILEGKAIKVRVLAEMVPENVDNNFPTDQKDDTIVPLTSFTKRIAVDYDQGEIPDGSSDADKMAITDAQGSGHISKALNELYDSIIAGGTSITVGAASPTGAQVEEAVNEGVANITARNGGYNSAIVFTISGFKLWIKAVGALFQRATDVHGPTKAGGPFRGYYLGFSVYVSPFTMDDGASTPTAMSGIMWDQMGAAYAPMTVDFKIDPFDPRGKYVIMSRFHFGVGVISALMAYYLINSA